VQNYKENNYTIDSALEDSQRSHAAKQHLSEEPLAPKKDQKVKAMPSRFQNYYNSLEESGTSENGSESRNQQKLNSLMQYLSLKEEDQSREYQTVEPGDMRKSYQPIKGGSPG